MRRTPVILIALAVFAAGCGGGDGRGTTTAAPPETDLREHLLVKGDLDDGEPGEPSDMTAAEWAEMTSPDDASDASGFVSGVRQDHLPGGGFKGAALSMAGRYESPERAQAAVDSPDEFPGDPPTEEFEVPGIPGAFGLQVGELPEAGIGIEFAVGDVYHQVAAQSLRASRAQVITAAQRLYERVK